jgi:hypothetical protein
MQLARRGDDVQTHEVHSSCRSTRRSLSRYQYALPVNDISAVVDAVGSTELQGSMMGSVAVIMVAANHNNATRRNHMVDEKSKDGDLLENR